MRTRGVVLGATVAAAVIVGLLLWQLGPGGGTDAPSPQQRPSAVAGAAPEADFDGDGTSDVVAPVSTGTVHGKRGAGYITVTYGSGDGNRSGRRQLITQDDPGVPGGPERNPFGWDETRFGEEAVTRDLDGDGYTDLATNGDIGAHYYAAGADVTVLWGSPQGLKDATRLKNVTGQKRLTPSFGGPDSTEASLTGGDFDGDGDADLVLGLGSKKAWLKGPFDRDGRPEATGAVPAPALPEGADEENTDTGQVLSGDLTGDDRDDLVSIHHEGTESHVSVTLAQSQSQSQSQSQAGSGGFGEPAALSTGADAATIGDVDGDGYGDLVLGHRDGGKGHGTVEILHGSSKGLDTDRRVTLDQDTPGVPGKPQKNGKFGAALDIGDVDGDHHADIAVGSPGQTVDGHKQAGSVTVLKGGPEGVRGAGADVVARPAGLPPAKDVDGGFGSTVRLSDQDGDGRTELAVGAPDENTFTGAVWLLPDDLDAGAARPLVPEDFDARDKDAQFGHVLAG